MNDDPWSYVFSVRIGYLVDHLVSTMFGTVVDLLSSYCGFWYHPVTGSIMVTDFIFRYSFFTFLIMTGNYQFH